MPPLTFQTQRARDALVTRPGQSPSRRKTELRRHPGESRITHDPSAAATLGMAFTSADVSDGSIPGRRRMRKQQFKRFAAAAIIK